MPDRAAMNRIGVVVPAHNEAALIGRCLDSIVLAARGCAARVDVVVVADSCVDGTARLAHTMGARVVEIGAGNVGRARAEGCEASLRDAAGDLWLAHTDADSAVPRDWLARQLRYAGHGAEVVAGAVEVDSWLDWPAALRGRYEAFYAGEQTAGRHHIHGANLGLSAHAYRAVGGFRPLVVGEDRALIAAAERTGLSVAYPTDLVVRTSGRRGGRVDGGGFHQFLARMESGGPGHGADDPPSWFPLHDDGYPASWQRSCSTSTAPWSTRRTCTR
ncbi:MAG TPA: glycosyltransferase [Rugosimonospora sp.]|jgi:glycosyltransferase involved in cell wall biosynthesis